MKIWCLLIGTIECCEFTETFNSEPLPKSNTTISLRHFMFAFKAVPNGLVHCLRNIEKLH